MSESEYQRGRLGSTPQGKGTSLTMVFDAEGNAIHFEGTYIYFNRIGKKPKTEIWEVKSKEGESSLGIVRWFGRWRQYAFFPESGLVFEKKCLREIANFTETLTQKQRYKK